MNPSQTYYPHPRYLLTVVVGVLLAGAFTVDLAQNFMLTTALFCAAAMGLALWSGQLAFSRVEVTAQGLTVYSPLGQAQRVEFRQLTSVTLDGRLTPVLTLIYHPQQPDGLFDLDAIRTIHLPTVRDQDELLTQLQARIPV